MSGAAGIRVSDSGGHRGPQHNAFAPKKPCPSLARRPILFERSEWATLGRGVGRKTPQDASSRNLQLRPFTHTDPEIPHYWPCLLQNSGNYDSMTNNLEMAVGGFSASSAVRLLYMLTAISIGGVTEWKLTIADTDDGRRLTIRWLDGIWRIEFDDGQYRPNPGVENVSPSTVASALRSACERCWKEVMSYCGIEPK